MATSTAQAIATVPVYDYLMAPGDPTNTNPQGLRGKKVKVTLSYAQSQSASPVTFLGTDPVIVETDLNGFWQVHLVANNKINPAGTLYTVEIEGNRNYLINVTDVGVPGIGWQSSAIAVLPPISGGVGYTLPGGTIVLGDFGAVSVSTSVGSALDFPAGVTNSLVTGTSSRLYDKGGEAINLFGPKYRAIGTWDPVAGTGDGTAAFQQAINDALAGPRKIAVPGGTILVNGAGIQSLSIGSSAGTDNSILISGVGRESVIKVKPGTIPATGGLVFNLFGTASTFQFENLTFDGSGQTVSSNFYKCISADGNAAGGDAAVLRVHKCYFTGFACNSGTNLQALAINTFGCGTQFLTDLFFEACDVPLFITQPFVNSVNRTMYSNLYCHNITDAGANGYGAGILFEGFGGVTGTNLQVVSDALSNVDGLRIQTNNVIRNVAIYGARFEGIGKMVNGGAGGTNVISDSALMGLVARNCKGSYRLAQFDSSCDILGLSADNCAQGGIPADTVFGSLETGGGAADLTTIVDFRIKASANNGISVNGPTQLFDGNINGFVGAPIVWQSNQATSIVVNVGGFNPSIRQNPAFAASFTPNLANGTNISVGALTGNITINAPTPSQTSGQLLTLVFLQDGTGGRTATWNAVFKTAFQPAPGANAISSITFMFDGTNWQQIGGQVAVDQVGNAAVVGTLSVTGILKATSTIQQSFGGGGDAYWDAGGGAGINHFRTNAGGTEVARITSTGQLEALLQLYPGAEASGLQTTGGILHATGVPSNANGNNNDWCISDNGKIYFRTGGVWVEASTLFSTVIVAKDLRRSRQAPAFNASLTVDATAGEMVSVGALTGNITINAPTNAASGQRLMFVLLQDGTGGRTVVWNAVFKQSWSDTGNTLNKVSKIAFQYDGTNWQQDGAQTPYQ
jgi:hypothetical protein